MFDPGLSIYATMVLSNLTKGINDQVYTCGPLYITADSEEYILLNWDFKYCNRLKHPDTITFYTLNEDKEILEEQVSTQGKIRGYYQTHQKFPTPMTEFPHGWNKDESPQNVKSLCLPFVIESSRKDKVVDRRCLRIYPSWMKNFGDLRIGEMMIPGTHNAGAWTGVPTLMMNRYVLNQDRDLYEQLVFGQRYFDIRVGIPAEREYRITHNIIQTSNFEEELENVAMFVEKSPLEIVILDIHQFNIPAKFEDKEHIKVINLIRRKLGKYLLPKSATESHRYGPALKKLWSYKRSVIVAYREQEWVDRVDFLWPAIHRDWGNKIDNSELRDYMIHVARSNHRGNPMKVLMAEMTPNLPYILMNPKKGLGLLADEVNRNITLWLRDYKLGPKINLIASDFFLGNRMAEFAVGINNMKLKKRKMRG